ncbi:RNA-directed DNA polymerase, eukaryota [Tanacetum coccineum]
MENLRSNFFNGIQEGDRKIVWVKWIKVLAAKKFGGLGVSSFFALNRGLIAKWVWRFISGDNSLWCKFISATHGSSHSTSNVTYPSIWKSILKEFYSLKVQGIDIFSHCKIKIGNGLCTRFWKDRWLDNTSLAESFPRLFALETDIDISVAAKLQSIVASFRRSVRGGVEDHQLQQLVSMLDSVILSSSNDRWICDLNGDGIFRVKDIRNLLDEFFLPKVNVPTRWVNVVPIKVNIFAWKLALDRLPTRKSGGQQLEVEGEGDENVPLYYYVTDNLTIQFGREEFCLVTGLKFGVENLAEYGDVESRIPFRRRVFPSNLDGEPITGTVVYKIIDSELFDRLDDDDAVSLCCLGILQLVLLGVEGKRRIPTWLLRLANDRVGWDNYPWGSYVWPTLYSQLKNANVKRWPKLYVTQPTSEIEINSYSIFGYTWAFKILESFRVTATRYYYRYNQYPRVAAWKRKGKFLGSIRGVNESSN